MDRGVVPDRGLRTLGARGRASRFDPKNPDGHHLLDLAMPHMGGDEVLTMLREIDPEVKVLVSSGNMDEELKVPSLDKPYTFEDFDSAFAELLPKQD